jgi:hypothetical protein
MKRPNKNPGIEYGLALEEWCRQRAMCGTTCEMKRAERRLSRAFTAFTAWQAARERIRKADKKLDGQFAYAAGEAKAQS